MYAIEGPFDKHLSTILLGTSQLAEVEELRKVLIGQ
jgi:hypothetical protein